MLKDQRDVAVQNDALCRQFMAMNEGRQALSSAPRCRRPLPDVMFVRIRGIPDFWRTQSVESYLQLFQQIPGTMVEQDSLFAFLLCGDAAGVRVYMGTDKRNCHALVGALQGFLPSVQLEQPCSIQDIAPVCGCGGVMIGNPNEPELRPETQTLQLAVDNICRGMSGSQFTVLVLARRVPNQFPMEFRKSVIQLMRDLSLYQRVDREGVEGEHHTQENYEVQEYLQNLQKTGAMLQQSMSSGLWQTTVYYAADCPPTTLRLQGILKGGYNTDSESVCQPVICLNMNNIRDYICPECAVMEDLVPQEYISPVQFERRGPGGVQVYAMNSTRYQTMLSGQQLGLLCRLPQHEYPGYYIDNFVEFDRCSRVEHRDGEQWVRIGTVTQPGHSAAGFEDIPYELEMNDFTRHLLVIGITGGGKSNTSKSLLSTLWGKYHKPFLVIESAKREYHELMKLDEPGTAGPFSQLCVFTMGDDNVLPYRINPFERTPGVGLQTHIDYVLSSFNAAFELVPPMPYVLESSVFEIYEDRGWNITTGKNLYGRTDYPTLTDLYYKIDEVVDRMGYYVEVQNNVKAALKARINSLRIGGKGLMMDTPRSVPIGSLLDKPVVLELEDLADDDTKAFVIGILMVQLYEYRKGQSLLASEHAGRGDVPASSKKFQHLLVIEEAHRLLKRVEPGSNPSRAKSVEFFCNMLAEIRSYGQGMMICDQVPTKLASDVLKNTNLKLIHRTVMEEDRRAVGAAMNMTPEQMEYLSSLRRGCAATFAEGDNRPKLVMMPLVKDRSKMGRGEIVARCRENIGSSFQDVYTQYKDYDTCRFCPHPCQQETRRRMEELAQGYPVEERLRSLAASAREKRQPLAKVLNCLYLLRFMKMLEQNAGVQLQPQDWFCLAGIVIEKSPLEPAEKYALTVQFQKYWYNTYGKTTG